MRTTRILALAATAALAVGLSACASGTSGATAEKTTGDSSAAFPVTIEHVYGETTIEAEPKRIATVAWANAEVPLSFGIVPVGMSKATWGDDDKDGVLPWVEDKLTELGADTPVLFDETDGIDFEAVADTQPDVILAAYSGITKDDYETLSKIAPVVAYPKVAWGTSMNDMIRMNATAIGHEADGEELITRLETETNKALDAHAALKDSTVLFSYVDPTDKSQIGYYTQLDTRPGFLAEFGVPMPTIVKDSASSKEFYLTVSAEEATKFDDVDLFVTYGDPGDDTVKQLQADPLLGKVPAIAAGSVAILENDTPLAASANPSPLSIPWGIDDYFALLADALPAK